MSDKELELAKISKEGRVEKWRLVPSGIGNAANSLTTEFGSNTSEVFDEDGGRVNVIPITVNGVPYQYVPFGVDNMLPYKVKDTLLDNMVTAQCQAYNIMTCYGQGIRFVNREDFKDTDNREILDFCLRNSLHECFLEQCTDMKFYYFSVTCVILSRDGKKIVNVRNKDASFCRFEYAPSTKSGNIEHVFFGDFRIGHFDEQKIEVIPLLDFWDPLGDLEVRMGLRPDPETGLFRFPTGQRKFAILSRMPTPGLQYYPMPYYTSVFRDAWLDIYRLIGISKRFMIKNTSAPRIQIEVHEDYWDNVCDNEMISDPDKRKERKEKEKRDIIEFVCGVENAGKALVSGYYIDPNGKENRMVRVSTITDGSKKEGGNWSDDMQEAANALCFAFGVHPNLVGATPGKSQMNNSGSDKRELFTLKQAVEKAFHDVMAKPYHVILHYNGWSEKYTVDVPMIQLTTLDENKDSEVVSGQANKKGSEDGDD